MGKVRSRHDLGVTLTPSNIEGGGGEDLTIEGELAVDSSDNKLKARLDSATRSVVTENQSQTLSNKSIDADNNPITNLEVDNLKAAVLNIDSSLTGASDTQIPSALAAKSYADSIASSEAGTVQTNLNNHTGASTDVHGLAGGAAVVGTTSTQTLSNKTLTGASIQTPTRLDAKQDTKANLVTYALTAANGQFAFATDEKKMYQVIDTFLVDVGGGAGGINYILNPDAENDTTGYVRYQDAASAIVVDGTEGTPSANLTFTRSTSSPLRGQASFLIDKAAVDMQGYGVSYDFTIDPADQAKILRTSFDFSSSANYVDADIRIYIYDITNSRLIEVIDRDLYASANGFYIGSWQSSIDSVNYRAILHVASTNANAYTVKIDNFQIGPQVLNHGFFGSDWESFIPTGSMSTNTTYTGKYRRVGDSAEVEVMVSFAGAPTATTLTVNLPSGLLIDTSKLNDTTTNVGGIPKSTAILYDSGAAQSGRLLGNVFYNNSTRVTVGIMDDLAATDHYLQQFSSTAPVTVASGDKLFLSYTVPIAGWSSNLQLSEDFGGRDIAFKAYLGSAANHTSLSGFQKVPLDTVEFDTTNSWSTVDDRFNVPESGYYYITSLTSFGTISDTKSAQSNIYVNGSISLRGTLYSNGATDTIMSLASGVIYLTKGQYVESYGYQTDSASEAYSTGSSRTYLSGFKLASPQTLAGSEIVACSYTSNSGQAVTNGNTVVYEDLLYDTHGSYNTSTGIYTVPLSGKYKVSGGVLSASVVAALGNALSITAVTVSTTKAGQLDVCQNVASRNYSSTVSCSFNLSKGETIQIKFDESLPAVNLISSGQYNFLTIEKVG